ncbi:MAG: hypothetical protein MZV70_45010 [Desulfobacterales bacterium]|nr:hypothetical protein [Desulfobacterales bacterium]
MILIWLAPHLFGLGLSFLEEQIDILNYTPCEIGHGKNEDRRRRMDEDDEQDQDEDDEEPEGFLSLKSISLSPW